MTRSFFIFLICLFWVSSKAQKMITADVLVVGGGTGGTAAGIQSARLGAKTLIVESGPWLGGMISAAGVTATDGNHNLPSGIWNEFRNRIYAVYGGPKAVATGWVSHTQFEPHVADSIFKKMASAEKALTVLHRFDYGGLEKKGNRITQVWFRNPQTGETLVVRPRVVIDATELGDVLKDAGAPYNLGMEADALSGETVGVTKTNDIVQDLTWAAILKDYGPGADKTIPKPVGYDPAEFDGSSTDYYKDKSRKAPSVNGQRMLDYGRLPNNKFMINWPIYGNDTYLNVVELTRAQREQELEKAKQTTLRFVYFIQQHLGYKNLGLADDEFPTVDGLALMPYHREGRRVKGLVRFLMRHISEPFTYGDPLYRTGISVGDYPIDHHHKKNEKAPQHLEFYPIPSYNIPLGAMIPQEVTNLVVAEKGISVSNVANGTTRLQPVVMLTGQAAGVLAALSSQRDAAPKAVPVRTVQETLLKAKAFIMPYLDVKPESPHFEAVQKVGATGLLRGKGIPYQWANQTWFYPDSVVSTASLKNDVSEFSKGLKMQFKSDALTVEEAVRLAQALRPSWFSKASKKKVLPIMLVREQWQAWGLKEFDLARLITRLELAVLLHHTVDPFSMKAVNYKGFFTSF
jgi:hypothetical protein